MKLTNETVVGRLTPTRWLTAGQVTDDLRQCGPLAFHGGDAEYREFDLRNAKQQYQTVYRVLIRLRDAGLIDCVLGDDRGNEVRTFRLFG